MTFNIHLKLDNPDETLDDDAISTYIEQLTNLFSKSIEGQQIIAEQGPIRWIYMFLEYAVDYLDVLPAEMTGADVENLLFQIFPEKVSAPASDAPEIIKELRAFFQFLAREYQLKNAAECLRALTNKASIQFEKLMADPNQYGMAKSMVMEGFARGYDMTDEKQINKWMTEYNQQLTPKKGLLGSLFPNIFGGPSVPEFLNTEFTSERGKQKADKTKKAKRKMKQATQKKNRKRK